MLEIIEDLKRTNCRWMLCRRDRPNAYVCVFFSCKRNSDVVKYIIIINIGVNYNDNRDSKRD